MLIPVEIEEAAIEALVKTQVAKLFDSPGWRGEGGIGYQAAKRAAAEYLASIDWRPLVEVAASRLMGEVVAEVVRSEIKRQASIQAKLVLSEGGVKAQ
jgi:hypothetical protein